MQYHNTPGQCVNCNHPVHPSLMRHSVDHYGYVLCPSCQEQLKTKLQDTTRETVKLYFSLKKRGVQAELEKFDGFESIDIAILDAIVNIEVDSPQKSYNPVQALADLKRSCYTTPKGYFTLRIPNALVAYNLEETVDCITDFLKTSNQGSYIN